MKIKLSHAAIACTHLKDVAERLKVLSLQIAETHEVPSEKVRAAMLPVEVAKDFRIELLEPSSPDSPISKFLSKRSQGGLHHLSFEVENLEAWEKTLKANGIQVLPPGIRKAARGKALFIHPNDMGGVLVELEEHS